MALASDLIQSVKLGARELQSSIIQGVGEASEFVRKNPVTSAVGVSGGVLAGITAIQIVRKTRKKSSRRKKSVSRARKKKSSSRRKVSRKKKTHASPRHRGHKRVVFTTKGGKKVSFLVKKPIHKHRKRRSAHGRR